MSQFSNKFYKHYLKDRKKPLEDEVTFRWWEWTFWIAWGTFEWLVIFLLLVIIFLLWSGNQRCQNNSQTPQYPFVVSQKQTPAYKENVPEQQLGQAMMPNYILPQSNKLVRVGENVSIKEYSYFVNDTNSGYPNFIDPQTHRLIKNKAPKCIEEDCPVVGVDAKSKENYILWLNSQTQQTYTLQNNADGTFKVKLHTQGEKL